MIKLLKSIFDLIKSLIFGKDTSSDKLEAKLDEQIDSIENELDKIQEQKKKVEKKKDSAQQIEDHFNKKD